MTKEGYWFWLCSAPDFYRDDIARLLSVCESPEEVFKEDKDRFVKQHLISEQQKSNLEQTKREGSFRKELERMKKEGIRFLCPDSADYPERLRKIPEAPFSLYVKGTLPAENVPSVGMVGARAATEYGKNEAKRFAAVLAANGVQIVSGMAAGIDGVSARGALSSGGKTFAVLGTGVDVIFPMSNLNLYYEILEQGGGILSEYPPGTPGIGWQFPFRNRLISGLSDRLLVMEARQRSGTLITVRYALEQGKDIYALPGRVTDKCSESCNRMIADGAGILISPESLLKEIFPVDFEQNGAEKTGAMPHPGPPEGTVMKKIYDVMEAEPCSVYNIIEKSQESPDTIMAALCEMELNGLIREVSQNIYMKIF